MAILETVFRDQLLEVPEDRLVKLQAIWRGAVVRKQFKVLRLVYQQVFQEVEGKESPYEIIWAHPGLCPVQAVHADVRRRQTRLGARAVTTDNRSKVAELPVSGGDGQSGMQQYDPSSRQPINSENKVSLNSMSLNKDNSQEDCLSKPVTAEKRECSKRSDKCMNPVRDHGVTDVRGSSRKDGHTHREKSSDKQGIEKTPQTQVLETEQKEVPSEELHDSSVSTEDLQAKRQHLLLELVWAQQAIASRKQYLRLKNQMGSGS